MNKRQLQADVPFDQFSRQFQVMTIINSLRKNDESYKILDVGGYKGRTADFLPQDQVTVMDLFDVKEDGYVKGSALDMPFKDDSFDYIMSFDVLEHIPSSKRATFVRECARVAKKGVIICAPHKTDANELAEQSLNDLYKRLHGEEHRWLKEHIAYGIPDFEAIEKLLQKQALQTVAFPSNKTRLWVDMQQAIFTNSLYPLASEQVTKLNTYYNKHFEYDGGETAEGSYRLILCGFRDTQTAEQVRLGFSTMNKAIPVVAEIALADQLQKYYETLLGKMSHLQADYQRLHEHEKKRAEELEANGKQLWERVNAQDKQLQEQASKIAEPLYVQAKSRLRKRLRR
jgi:hypothetical protein